VQSDLVEKGKRKEGIAQAKTLRSKKNKKEEEEEKTKRNYNSLGTKYLVNIEISLIFAVFVIVVSSWD